MKPQPGSTVDTVRDFWQAHINNEYYTDAERASDAYFDEIERRRYDTHYHLPELFASLDGAGRSLLEVGCGIGVDSIQLAKRGFAVTAVDLTENALAVARQFAARRGVSVDFRLGNAEGLDFPDQSFDAVYSFGVLHHTPDIERSVAEVHRVLRPGGHGVRDALPPGFAGQPRAPGAAAAVRVARPTARTTARSCTRSAGAACAGCSVTSRSVEVHSDYPFTYGFGPLTTKLPLGIRRPLGRVIGWHLMITARR